MRQACEFDLRRYEADCPARAVALEAVTRFEADGVPEIELRRCSEHGRDGTNLQGCLKVYLVAHRRLHGRAPWVVTVN
jgi:hypothetical protein